MQGLWRTAIIFAVATGLLWAANKWDVRNEFTAIDVLLWFCGILTIALLIRLLREALTTRSAHPDERLPQG